MYFINRYLGVKIAQNDQQHGTFLSTFEAILLDGIVLNDFLDYGNGEDSDTETRYEPATSVADPECLSRIRIFPSRIPDPPQRI
jgi:hypothetical protein